MRSADHSDAGRPWLAHAATRPHRRQKPVCAASERKLCVLWVPKARAQSHLRTEEERVAGLSACRAGTRALSERDGALHCMVPSRCVLLDAARRVALSVAQMATLRCALREGQEERAAGVRCIQLTGRRAHARQFAEGARRCGLLRGAFRRGLGPAPASFGAQRFRAQHVTTALHAAHSPAKRAAVRERGTLPACMLLVRVAAIQPRTTVLRAEAQDAAVRHGGASGAHTRRRSSLTCSTAAGRAARGAMLPRRPLGNTGLEVSVIGFGASPLGGVFEVRAHWHAA